MARLTIEQIRAPDLSVASAATARAGEAFQRGMSSASDLLSQYQSGLEAQGDAELTNLLAGASTEEEWNQIVANTDFSQMNLSEGMRQNIMNRRDNVLGYEQDRATRRGTDATTANTQATTARTYNTINLENNRDGRASDIHGVTMADHAWRQGARAEDAALAGMALGAAIEDTTNGYQRPTTASGLIEENVSGLVGGPPGTNLGPRADGSGLSVANPRPAIQANDDDVLMLARTLQAEAGNQGLDGMMDVGSVIANRVGDSRYGDGTIRGVVMKNGQFSAWNGVTGYAGGEQGQNMNFQPNAEAMAAAQAIISGNYEDRTNGATHYVNKNISNPSWGNNVTYQRGDHWFGQADGPGNGQRPTPQSNARPRATQNPNQGGPARAAYQTALANSRFQSTSDVLAAYERSYDYAATGEAAITAEDARLGEEAFAQTILDVAEQNVSPTEAILQFREDNPGATAVERLKFEADAIAATGDGGALSAAQLQIGTTGASPGDIGMANATIADMQERQQRDPFQFAQIAAEAYVDNPVGQLETALKGFDISTVPAELEAAINTLAQQEGITRAEAAYSFARAAEIDIPLVPDWSIGGNNLAENRAAEFARQNFKGEQSSNARRDLQRDRIIGEQITTTTRKLGEIEREIQKLQRSGATVDPSLISQRDDLKGELMRFEEQYGAQARDDAAQGGSGTPAASPPQRGGGGASSRLEQSLRQG